MLAWNNKQSILDESVWPKSQNRKERENYRVNVSSKLVRVFSLLAASGLGLPIARDDSRRITIRRAKFIFIVRLMNARKFRPDRKSHHIDRIVVLSLLLLPEPSDWTGRQQTTTTRLTIYIITRHRLRNSAELDQQQRRWRRRRAQAGDFAKCQSKASGALNAPPIQLLGPSGSLA